MAKDGPSVNVHVKSDPMTITTAEVIRLRRDKLIKDAAQASALRAACTTSVHAALQVAMHPKSTPDAIRRAAQALYDLADAAEKEQRLFAAVEREQG